VTDAPVGQLHEVRRVHRAAADEEAPQEAEGARAQAVYLLHRLLHEQRHELGGDVAARQRGRGLRQVGLLRLQQGSDDLHGGLPDP